MITGDKWPWVFFDGWGYDGLHNWHLLRRRRNTPLRCNLSLHDAVAGLLLFWASSDLACCRTSP
jgi:hypothetical protein